jgi:hypothetical protein
MLLSACFKHDDCDQNVVCNTTRPDSGYLNINVTDPGTVGMVPIAIYEGDIDKNNVLLSDTLYSKSASYYLPVKKRYGVRATYIKNGVTTYVYDGARIKLNKFWNCNDKCYEAIDGNIHVELK